jgi:hypothetical protein
MPEDTTLYPVKKYAVAIQQVPGTQDQALKLSPQPSPPTPVAPINPAPKVPQKSWLSPW